MIQTITPSTAWIERYETLRRHVLHGGQIFDNDPLSLVLWLTYGMAGWMRHWTKAVKGTPSPEVPPPSLRLAAASLWQQQLTLVLAQITLQRLNPTPRL